MVNANTFQQGKLIGYFTPFVEYTGDRFLASNFPSSYTTYPYVINDASVGNSTDLLIPYVAPYSSYRLTDKVGNIGTFYLKVLNRLLSGDCSYTVYAWFTNISVDLPTGKENALTTTSSMFANLKRLFKSDPKKVSEQLGFVAQAMGEAEQKSSGIVSATLHTVSDIGTALSSVPMLAPVAGPVAWVSKAAAGVAEFFGWSKPLDLSNLQKYVNIPAYSFTQGTGTDSGVVLATTQDNSIESRGDLFGSNIDEMEISWIVAHKSFVDRFNMTTDNNPGDDLYNFPVTPGWCQFNNPEYEPTVMAYISSMFRYWRGSLKYKIQAVKTAYHSGRVRVVYLPAASDFTVDAPDQAYNWVFDLRNSSEIEFEIPYNNIVEWERCGLTANINSTFSIGVIRIEVLNKLRAPASVSQEIQFNVWISGGSDLQFAVPDFSRYIPSLTPPPSTFVAQVLGSAQDAGFNDMSDKPCMFEQSSVDKITPCKVSIGEMVRNLRVLTRRFGLFRETTITENTTIVALPNYFFGNAYETGSPADYRITPIDYISWIYKFFRGGVRWKSFYAGPITAGGQQRAVLAPGTTFKTVATITEAEFDRYQKSCGSFQHRVFTNVNPVLEVTAPFYSQVPIRPIQDPKDETIPLLDNTSVYHRLDLNSTGSPAGSLDIYKAASDDFTFGWLVGPPYLVPQQETVTIPFADTTSVLYLNSSKNYEIRFSDSDLDFPQGTYIILESVPAGATVPAVFSDPTDPTTVQIPLAGGVFEWFAPTSSGRITVKNTSSSTTLKNTESLVAVQLVGDTNIVVKLA
jgi:hypothetical protein